LRIVRLAFRKEEKAFVAETIPTIAGTGHRTGDAAIGMSVANRTAVEA